MLWDNCIWTRGIMIPKTPFIPNPIAMGLALVTIQNPFISLLPWALRGLRADGKPLQTRHLGPPKST